MAWDKGGVLAFALAFICLAWSAQAQNTALPAASPEILKPGAGTVSQPVVVLPKPSEPGRVIAGDDEAYRLGAGDKMRITVYGEQDLSGEFLVNATGRVEFPLIGEIRAAGLTVQEFVRTLTSELGSKYLRNPKVSIEIQNYRPFYIIGEVNKPGEYPYESGLSLHGAVALAGGYTYRANDSSVYIRRVGSDSETSMRVTGQIKIYPGDVVRIPERFF